MDDAIFILKLRNNISLEGDLQLAHLELSELSGLVVEASSVERIIHTVPECKLFPESWGLERYLRANGKQAFLLRGQITLLPDLVKYSAFVQEIFVIGKNDRTMGKLLERYSDYFPNVLTLERRDGVVLVKALPYFAIFEFAESVVRASRDNEEVKGNLSLVTNTLLGKDKGEKGTALVEKVLAAKTTSSPLSHGIHYYKAKFFPRMARSLINVGRKRVGKEDPVILDNFVGSGTTLLEAYTLGLPSLGVDIDPLSVIISKCKIEILLQDEKTFWEETERVKRNLSNKSKTQATLFDSFEKNQTPDQIEFPNWLMKNRNMTKEIASSLSSEIVSLRTVIRGANPKVQPVLNILLSDAISRKIRMRILGTGAGRFSLTFAQSSLSEIFLNSMEKSAKTLSAWNWMREHVTLKLSAPILHVGDARSLPLEPSSCDIILTSPPYLPASSGRESYAKSRALSIIALGLKTPLEVDELIGNSVGAMNGLDTSDNALTEKENALVSWLLTDQLRSIKAKPIARYFIDMRLAFREMYRVLSSGGVAFVVCSKQSTFYQFKTRETLYTVPVAEMLAEEASGCGFIVDCLYDIELDKANMNARPRSLDEYYETVIILKKPEDS